MRALLADLLNCTPMRISKKFCGSLSVGKRGYRQSRVLTIAFASIMNELTSLERAFHRSLHAHPSDTLKLSLFGTSGLPTPVANPSVLDEGAIDDNKKHFITPYDMPCVHPPWLPPPMSSGNNTFQNTFGACGNNNNIIITATNNINNNNNNNNTTAFPFTAPTQDAAAVSSGFFFFFLCDSYSLFF